MRQSYRSRCPGRAWVVSLRLHAAMPPGGDVAEFETLGSLSVATRSCMFRHRAWRRSHGLSYPGGLANRKPRWTDGVDAPDATHVEAPRLPDI